MIKGNMKDASLYENLYPGFREAFRALREYTKETALGKHVIDGDRLFANVQRYESKSPADAKFENHHKYIDVQYMIYGQEKIRVTAPDGLTLTDAYNEGGDCELFAMTENYTELDMRAGDFAILFPGEPHAPGIRYDGETAETVGKVVVKVLVK